MWFGYRLIEVSSLSTIRRRLWSYNGKLTSRVVFVFFIADGA